MIYRGWCDGKESGRARLGLIQTRARNVLKLRVFGYGLPGDQCDHASNIDRGLPRATATACLPASLQSSSVAPARFPRWGASRAGARQLYLRASLDDYQPPSNAYQA